MSLINCPQCGKIVSDRAVRCPHCKKELKPNTDAPKDERESKVVAQSDVKTPQSQSCPTQNIVDSYKWLFAIFVIVVVLVVGCLVILDSRLLERDDATGVTTSGGSDEIEKSPVFVTLDLSAFLLHGHVKKVIESDGRMICFDSNGKISHYNDDVIDSDEEFNVKYDKEYDKDILRIAGYGFGVGKEFQIDKINRLTTIHIWMGNAYEAEKKFSDYDKDGWPTKWKFEEGYRDGSVRTTTATINYSEIDEYGNWRIKSEIDNEGNTSTIHRNIEYY